MKDKTNKLTSTTEVKRGKAEEIRLCKKCGSKMEIWPGNDIAHDINVCSNCNNRTIGQHQEPYYNYGDDLEEE